MSADLSLVIALVCYGVLLTFRVHVGRRRSITLGAAFVPIVVLIGARSPVATVVSLAVGAAAAIAVPLLFHRPLGAAWLELNAFVAASVMTRAVAMLSRGIGLREPVAVVVAGSVGVASFAIVDALSARIRNRSRMSAEERRVYLLLYGLLVSAFGLTILVYEQIGWIALVAVLLPLLLTKREFDRYALAKSTLEETVTVLGQLEARSL